MKKITLELVSFCLVTAFANAVPLLRIMPLGDSITEGAGATSTAGYRGPLWTLLANAGYNVDYVGSNTTNPDTTNGMDRDHEGHGGWRLDTLYGGNGIFEMLPSWFSSIESPDVILLHLGTNDSNADTLNDMTRTTALLDRLFAMQPGAHVVITTLMWRNDATRYARIQTYNSNLTNVVAVQVAKGQSISILDMHAAVPGGAEFGTINFGDGLHPNTTGYALMANAWFGAIQQLYPDPNDFITTRIPSIITATPDASTSMTITLRLNTAVTQASAETIANYTLTGGTIASAALNTSSDSRTVTLTLAAPAAYGTQTLTVSGLVNAVDNATSSGQSIALVFPHPRGTENYVPASELEQYRLVYSVDPPGVGANYFDANIYAIDNHMDIGSFSRVAYYMELRPTGGDLQYVWVSMDAFTDDAAYIGIPVRARDRWFRQYVQNMKVWSNVAALQTGDRGQGVIEFWPHTYNMSNGLGVPGASGSVYDFGDSPTSGNYGCMQIHDVAAKQTIFAFNHWSMKDTAGNSHYTELGIGNSNLRSDSTDWTFSNNGNTYDIRRIQVYVLPDPQDRTSPTVVSAEKGFSNRKITVIFSKPIDPVNLIDCFAVNDGAVAIRSATRSIRDAHVVYILTDELPDNVTLSVDGVRDQSPHQNAIDKTEVTVTERPMPAEITRLVNANLIDGYEVLYALDIPQKSNFINNPEFYFIDESEGTAPVNRVAYFLETSAPGTPNTTNFIWVSTEAFTEKTAQFSIPFSTNGAWFQQKLRNTDIASNVSGITTGTGIETCNIEFWPTDYGKGVGPGGLGGSGSAFDYDDTKNSGGTYGSMQIHNYGAKQTLFAMNRWGGNNYFIGLGIGNRNSGDTDWTHADNAADYAVRRLYILVKKGEVPQSLCTTDAAIVERVPDATNYEMVIDYNIPVNAWMDNTTSNTSYRTLDKTAIIRSGFERVAYYLELVKSGSTETQYVWTAFDAMTQDPTKLGFPAWTFQQTVANLDVESNVEGIQTGKGITTGNIEFHNRNYGNPNAINIPGASGSVYDFGDRLDTGSNYGCMQVHNYGARQTLWAVNHFNGGNKVGLGIGNSTLRSDSTDWTFADNAGSYSHRRLCVFVSRAKVPQAVPMGGEAPRRAVVSLARNQVCVSFPSAAPKALLAAERYAFADASIQIVGVARSAAEPRDVLLTLAAPLTPNTTNTLNVTLSPYAADKALTVIAPSDGLPAFLTRTNVSELNGYRLLNALAIQNSVCYSYPGADYLVDESRFNAGMRYDRVAYCLELQDTNHYQWVFAGMDTFCEDPSKLGVPSVERQILHKCYVTNLTVYAGASDNNVTVQTGSFATGNLEFWPNNFAAQNDLKIPGASDSDYDFGDSMTATAPACGHGSMQVHNYLARETILSMVAFGHSGNTAQFRSPGLGIGNNPNSAAKKDPDWTFQEGTASNYSIKNFYVLVRPITTSGATGTGPQIVTQPDPLTMRHVHSGNVLLSVYAPTASAYQWRKNGVAIPNAVNRELQVSDEITSDATYDVLVFTDNANYSLSDPARVVIYGDGTMLIVR